MIDIKIEHNKCKLGAVTPIGIMFEINAPELPAAVREAKALARKRQAMIFVVDRSGSMGGGRLDMVKKTLIDALPAMDKDDALAVVSFDNEARIEIPVVRVGELPMPELQRMISRIRTGGNTNMEAGIRLGINLAASLHGDMERSVILLSDGHANEGATRLDVLGGLAASANESHKIKVNSIGIGAGYNEGLLEGIASCAEGDHLAALEQAEVAQALQSQIDLLLQKTMTNLKFSISPNREIVGPRTKVIPARQMKSFKPNFQGGAVAEYRDLSAGEQVNVVFQLDLETRLLAPGSVSAFKARLEYFDENEQRTVRIEQRFELELVEPALWVAPQGDPAVRAELQELRLQEIRNQAMELYMQGLEDEADELLKRAAAEFNLLLEDVRDQLSVRNFNRFSTTSDEMMFVSSMDDVNLKRKRIAEMRNRAARDRRDYRKPDQH